VTVIRRLEPNTQAHLLDLIGVTRYVRRIATPAASAAPTRPSPTFIEAEATPSSAPKQPSIPPSPIEPAARERPSLLAELGVDARGPQLLLFVETPRAPDPRGQWLLAAIRRLLPAHRMLDATDLPPQWLPQAIALGGHVAAPEGTRLHAAPNLSSLRQDTAAKRALWQAIRRLRRPARTD
jgi:hypothetical protein